MIIKQKNKVSTIVFWTPRLLSIIFIAFLMLMSLDVFDNGNNFWQTVVGLFMHNIPALILLVVLIISWKKEIVGGVAFILAGILYIIFAFKHANSWIVDLVWSLLIAGTAFIIGGLFILGWIIKIRQSKI